MLRDDGEAEETVQQVFFDVFRAVKQFDSRKGNFRTWLLQFAYHRSMNRREQLKSQRVYDWMELDEALPDAPTSPEMVLNMLDEIGSPATVTTSGRRFFGFVIGGSLPAALAANWMAGVWDQNAGLRVASPIAAKTEDVALGWLLDLLALPKTSAGAFVTGATMANFTALAAARHAVLSKMGWDVESDGLFGAPAIHVVVGAEAHPTLFRSLSLLGLGHQRVTKVPVDAQGRMRADAVLVLTAGRNGAPGAGGPPGIHACHAVKPVQVMSRHRARAGSPAGTVRTESRRTTPGAACAMVSTPAAASSGPSSRGVSCSSQVWPVRLKDARPSSQ
jgi:hypothetical protein